MSGPLPFLGEVSLVGSLWSQPHQGASFGIRNAADVSAYILHRRLEAIPMVHASAISKLAVDLIVSSDHIVACLDEVIGRGMYRTVRRAFECIRRIPVAVAIPRGQVELTPHEVEDETQIIKSCADIPGVVQVLFTVSRNPVETWSVMHYYPADLMNYLIESERVTKKLPLLSRSNMEAIVNRMVLTMALIHRKGIVHRDLKPENILIREDEQGNLLADLCDFGMACTTKSIFGFGERLIGTITFSAPELANTRNNDATFDQWKAGDVWALGCVFFSLYANRDHTCAINVRKDHKNDWKKIARIAIPWSKERNVFDSDIQQLGDVMGHDNPTFRLLKGMMDPNPLTRVTMSEAAAARGLKLPKQKGCLSRLFGSCFQKKRG